MIRGCFTNLLAGIGCLTVVCLAAFAAWFFRADIANMYRALVGRGSQIQSLEPTSGVPSQRALEAAREKEQAISSPGGPVRVVLSVDEIASLIADRLSDEAKEALDSIVVTLDHDRFTIDAAVRTDVFGRDLLGPLRGMIDPREPIHVSGPARVRAPGVIGWEIDDFRVASFPFPGPAIPVLVDRITGGTGGELLFAVPVEVIDLRIEPDGVTFYRRAN